jgi:uncharacterized protein (DUF1697 family)
LKSSYGLNRLGDRNETAFFVPVPRYIAFLRGINLGGRRPKMEQLRSLFEELGFAEVSTFIASGNVIFATRTISQAALEKKIARHLEQALGYAVDTFVRTHEEIAAVLAFPAFPKREAEAAGVTVHAIFLHDPLDEAAAQIVLAAQTDEDRFSLHGAEFYWLCRIRSVDSKVWTTPSMRKVAKIPMTMRNMTSLRKLAGQYKITGA